MPTEDEQKPTADEGPVERWVGRPAPKRAPDWLINLWGYGSLALLGAGIGGAFGHPLIGMGVALACPVVFVTAMVILHVI